MQLSKLGLFVLRKSLNSLFFNKKVDSFLAAGQRQLLEAFVQLGGGIKILVVRQLRCCQLAEMSPLFVMPEALEKASRRDMGLRLHGFNKREQQVSSLAMHVGQLFDIRLLTGRRVKPNWAMTGANTPYMQCPFAQAS